MIAACIETTKTQNKLVYLTFPIDVRPFPVFEENVGKIGFLPSDLARQVTQFYSYARASAQDFRTLSDQDLYAWPLPIAVRFLERIKKSIDDNAELAVNLIPKLRQEAERTWKDYLQPV